MKNMMGIIYTGERDAQLRELTAQRAVAAVPVLGRYRIIDFIMSSMVNSGIRNIGVIMQMNYHSLMDHLGSGKEWDLHGKTNGLVILPPFLTRDNVGVYEGFLDALRSNISYLRRSKERYVVVSDSHMLYTAHFDEMVEQHIASGADMTLMYTADPGARRNHSGRYIALDDDKRVENIEIDPTIPHYPNTYMDVFCIRRELLIDMVDRAVSRGEYHFVRGILQSALHDGTMKVMGYECKDRVWHIDSVNAYYQCSMELLDPVKRQALFSDDRPVWTKVRDEMPAHYLGDAHVSYSLLADGCVIEGTVENSILFRGVCVKAGAVVRNSIIMQDGLIGQNAVCEHCILDKQVTVRENTRLVGPASYPIVVAKDLIV